MNQKKNKLQTPSYFIKRLKDSGFETWKIFNGYDHGDPRKWTVLVDPRGKSVFITCFENTPFAGEYLFSFDDGNRDFTPGFSLKTDSMEIVVRKLLENGVKQREQTAD